MEGVMKEKEITKRQSDVLNFIKKYVAKHGFPPSVREICKGIMDNTYGTAYHKSW